MLCHDMDAPRAFFGTAVGLGNFDGLHLGHMALINKLTALASRRGLAPLAYMFREHPQNVLHGYGSAKLLTDNAAKCGKLARTALGCVCFDRFDERFCNMAPDDFARRVLRGRLDARLVVAGFNYRFGAGNSSSVEDLERLGARLGFGVHVVGPYKSGGEVVSSTGIRSLIEAGLVDRAREMLGRLYSISGEVKDGLRVGRTIDVPTANLVVDPRRLSPLAGVYATRAFACGRFYDAVTSVGPSPTVGGAPQGAVETHLIGFSGDLYGRQLVVLFHKRLRGMEKFSGLESLRAQIRRDADAAREYFSDSRD